MFTLPGFSPSPPQVVQSSPPPARDDPAIAAAKQKLRSSEARRRGGAASIRNVGGGEGDLGEVPTTRPEARAARLGSGG